MMFLIQVMMCLIMYFCVLGAIVDAMLIKIVFFLFRKSAVFAFFYINVNFTII